MALKPVPKDNKGLKKLPTQVRNKMGFMEKGGEAKKTSSMASRKKGREYTKLDYEKDKFKSVAKTVGKILLSPAKTFTGGLTGGVKQIVKAADEHRTEFPKVGSRKKNVIKKNKGGEVDPTKFTGSLKGNFKRLAGNAIQSLHNMTFPKEEREKLQKIQKDDLDKYYLDKEKKRKKRKAGKEMKKTVLQVIGKKQGGLVKGGTSSQMTGKEYKGTF